MDVQTTNRSEPAGLHSRIAKAPAITQEQLDRIITAAGGARVVDDIYPLSVMQQGILFHRLHEARRDVYVSCLSWRLRGAMDAQTLRRAWHHIVRRHTILRTAILGLDLEQSLQVVKKRVDESFAVSDWSDTSADEQNVRLQEFRGAERRRGFDMAKPPLMRLSLIRSAAGAWWLVLTHHHIVTDGWSIPVLLEELFDAYAQFDSGATPHLAPTSPYRDYIAWLQRQDGAAAEEYWRSRLAGFMSPIVLDIGRERKSAPEQAIPVEAGAMHDYVFSFGLAHLEAVAQSHKVTLSTMLHAAWALLLSRYSCSSDVVFGVTTAGRPPELSGADRAVGLFINALPLRIAVRGDLDVERWLQEVQRRNAELFEYQYSSLAQAQRCSELLPGQVLFESLVVVENYPVRPAGAVRSRDFRIDGFRAAEQSHYPLSLVFRLEHSLTLRLLYDSPRFDLAAMGRMVGHFEQLLSQIATHPQRHLCDLQILHGC